MHNLVWFYDRLKFKQHSDYVSKNMVNASVNFLRQVLCQLSVIIFVCVNIRTGHRGGGGDGTGGSLFCCWGVYLDTLWVFFSQTKLFAALCGVLMAFVVFVPCGLQVSCWKIDQCVVTDTQPNEQEFCFPDENVILLMSPGRTQGTRVLSFMELRRRHCSQEKFWWLILFFF